MALNNDSIITILTLLCRLFVDAVVVVVDTEYMCTPPIIRKKLRRNKQFVFYLFY